MSERANDTGVRVNTYVQGVRRRKAEMRREAALQPRAKSIASTIDPLKVLKKKISSTISGPGELLLKYKNFKAKVCVGGYMTVHQCGAGNCAMGPPWMLT